MSAARDSDDKKKRGSVETAVPARNFTVTTEERVRAIASGPPAYVRRKRAIEELEEGLVRVVAERSAQAFAARADDVRARAREAVPRRALDRLNDLIARHNRWYPIEADLPMQARTGALLDRDGQPWRPLPAVGADDVVERALRRLAGAGAGAGDSGAPAGTRGDGAC
jgi:hypothetical protein